VKPHLRAPRVGIGNHWFPGNEQSCPINSIGPNDRTISLSNALDGVFYWRGRHDIIGNVIFFNGATAFEGSPSATGNNCLAFNLSERPVGITNGV